VHPLKQKAAPSAKAGSVDVPSYCYCWIFIEPTDGTRLAFHFASTTTAA
jgi:hypothetical protein